MSHESIVSAIKYLDELFMRARRVNTQEIWSEYIEKRRSLEDTYFKKELAKGENPLKPLGISLEGAMRGNPAKQGPHVVQRWLKWIHLVDATPDIIAERCVVLSKHLGVPRGSF